MTIGELVKPMFDTVDLSQGPFGGGEAEATWKPLLIAELGKHIVVHGGFGLAAPVMTAMLRAQEQRSGT